MAKNVTLPPVRVEPELLEQMQRLSGQLNVSVYELTRMAVAEFVGRQQLAGVPASDRLMMVADGESLSV